MLSAHRGSSSLLSRQFLAQRSQSTDSSRPAASPASTSTSASPQSATLTGAAKLLADAIAEESSSFSVTNSRDHLKHTQGPIWDGDETTSDAVLRMLVDAHKPLRTGNGVKHNTADEKIKGWMKGLNLEPRLGDPVTIPTKSEEQVKANPHRTTIPPHLHRPWHSTYTSSTQVEEAPRVRYGTFIKTKASGEDLTNLLELHLPPGADGKTRAKVKEARRAGKIVRRFDQAREGALDYRLGLKEGELTKTGDFEDDETFRGNRQIRGSSALGAGKGGASGMRAWAGLVEDRIERAREAGFFKITRGQGAPIPRDPEAGNPHIDSGELIINRIVKRQGALPPWIELQNSLDSALNSFRATLLQTYTTHLVRTVISTNTLTPLPPMHSIPSADEAWEARELKFHNENIRQINDLVRRMNAQAPAVVRRALTTREMELDRIRGEVLMSKVWEEVKRRAEEIKFEPVRSQTTTPLLFPFQMEGLTRLKNATRRSIWTIAKPVVGIIGKGNVGGYDGPHGWKADGHGSGSGRGNSSGKTIAKPFFLVGSAGAGFLLIAYLRRPVHNDSIPINDFIPLHPPTKQTPSQPSTLVASSPSEPPMTVIGLVQKYILEPFLTTLRFLHLALLFGPVILTAPMLYIGSPEIRKKRGKPVAEEEETWGAVWWYGFLVRQMERAGPTFIKLGQWAASRADLFPKSLCEKMSKLHSNGDPHSLSHTKKVIEKAFGLKFDDIFEEFGEKPIGCGAIAQVYRATLRPEIISGTTIPPVAEIAKTAETQDDVVSTSVAIKVLHPRVHKTIRRDIAIMSLFANVIDALPGMKWFSLPDEVDVFGEMMNSQLDLRVESSNLEKFIVNFKKRGKSITFPKPIRLGDQHGDFEDEKVEKREVMVEEFEDALPLKYFLRNGGGPYDDKIATIGLDGFLEMLLLDNWTHGDLHPGNIMVRFYKPTSSDFFGPLLGKFTKSTPEPESNGIPHQSMAAVKLVHELAGIAHDQEAWLARLEELDTQGFQPQLIFIDAGLVTTLDSNNRKNFLDLFSAVAEFDGYKAGKLMVERCRTPEYAIDEETFALKMQHLILSVKSKTFSLAKIKISDILTDVLTAVRQHHVKMEGDFVNTVISILLLEGIGRQLDPDMDLFKSALPILRQLGRQMGTREAISAVPKGNIWAMAKVWVWMEAREVAGEATAIDNWIKFDRLSPGI
ncbi:hypothetical protein P7C73_g2519, partial [Tremellales sp. Uapishka_1]